MQSESEALDAFLFTERGVYRLGDAVHVGGIVRRRDWSGKMEGLPLEFEVTNSKDQVVETRRVPLPADGFLDLETKTDENDPTGIYVARIFVIQGNESRVLLNRRTFRVEEFQPDRMKLDVTFNVPDSPGWIAPGDVTASVSVQTLFGIAAADRRVKAKLELSPAEFALEPFPDFTFHNRLREESSSVAGQIVELGKIKTGDDGIAQFDLALKRFENACFSMIFFAEGFEADGGGKLVWLKNANFLADSQVGKTIAALEGAEAILDYVEKHLPPDVKFLLSATVVDKRRAAWKRIQKLADLRLFDKPDTSKTGWEDEVMTLVARRAREMGITFDEEALVMLVQLAGEDTRQLDNELEKLSLYLGKADRVTVDDVRAVVPLSRAGIIFEVGNAIVWSQPGFWFLSKAEIEK